MIVYAWVNDDDTKRAYESSDDAYRVFRKMLESGHPPDDWDQLLGQAELTVVTARDISGSTTRPA
jgi:toxin YhaV